MTLAPEQLQKIVEGAIMAAGKPLKVKAIQQLFEEDEQPESDAIQAALEDLQNELRGRGFELIEVASGWRFQVIQDVAPWIAKLWEEKPQKYSRALLETLALIAYRQPITRGDIEDIRGVAVSSHIIKTLTERDWIKVVGHKDVPGRPSLYATTRQFLDYFNLNNLDQLPTLAEIRDLDSLNAELDLEGADTPPVVDESADEERVDEKNTDQESTSQESTVAAAEDMANVDDKGDEQVETVAANAATMVDSQVTLNTTSSVIKKENPITADDSAEDIQQSK